MKKYHYKDYVVKDSLSGNLFLYRIPEIYAWEWLLTTSRDHTKRFVFSKWSTMPNQPRLELAKDRGLMQFLKLVG